jgi:hypothetical protein
LLFPNDKLERPKIRAKIAITAGENFLILPMLYSSKYRTVLLENPIAITKKPDMRFR